MTVELLQLLRSANAFDHQPTYETLRHVHVPFDRLFDTQTVEARLEEASQRNGRVALIGSSGCGKSSVISYVLRPEIGDLAPLVVPVSTVPAGTMIEPSTVADHLIHTVARRARELGSLDESAQDAALTHAAPGKILRTGRDSRGSVGLSFGWIKGQLATDLARQTDVEVSITPEEKFEVVEQILLSIVGHGLRPVLVFDDTDRWLSGLGHEDPQRVVEAFFGRVVRWIAELQCGVVVSVHDGYFTKATPRDQLLEFLDTPIDVPVLPHSLALDEILGRRIELVLEETPLQGAAATGAFEEGSVAHLFSIYEEEGHHLRWAIRTAHIALTEACDAGNEQITTASIDAAVAADR